MWFIFPIGHEENEVRRIPWISLIVVLACILVYWRICEPASRQQAATLVLLQEAFTYYQEHPGLELRPELAAELQAYGVELRFEGNLGDGGAVTGGSGDPGERPEDLPITTVYPGPPPRPQSEYFDPGMMRPEREESGYQEQPAGENGREASPYFRPDAEMRRAQQELDALFARYLEAKYAQGQRLGLIPAHFSVADLFASMFMHGGWWHLWSNLFILWLCGPALEDIWGRPFFAVFYLFAGAASGLVWTLLNLHSTIPMVGASGAIAGLMGAFAVRFWSAKIQFFYAYVWFLPARAGTGTFALPAWVTLGFWFGRELLNFTLVQVTGLSASVAFAAHVGGFAVGALAAGLIAFTGFEKKHLAPAIEKRLDQALGAQNNVELANAFAALDGGRPEEAWKHLRAGLEARPQDADCATALWDLAATLDRRQEALPPVLRQLSLELRGGDRQLALDRWLELNEWAPPAAVDPDLRWRLAEAQLAAGRREEAREVLDAYPLEGLASRQLGVKTRLLKAALAADSALMAPLAEHLAAQPGLPEAWQATVAEARERARQLADKKAVLDAMPGYSLAPPAPPIPPPAPLGVPAVAPLAPLQVFEATPLRFHGRQLEIEAGGQRQAIVLPQLAAVAVARIDEGPRPWLLIDLFFDPPAKPGARTVRLRSTGYDPRRELAPGVAEPMGAFLAFVQQLLEQSQARPLPSAEAAAGRPFARFAGVAEYEAALRRG